MGQLKLNDIPQGFPGIHALMQGNALKVSLVARAFYHSMLMDLERLQCAADQENWIEVRRLAQRVAIDCEQVSEHRGERAMASLSRLLDSWTMRKEYQRFHEDIVGLSAWSAASVSEYEIALAAPRANAVAMA